MFQLEKMLRELSEKTLVEQDSGVLFLREYVEQCTSKCTGVLLHVHIFVL